MRLLVTGGAGFIGSNIVRLLVDAGHQVVVLDNLSSGFLGNLSPFPQVRFIEGDIRDSEAVAHAINKKGLIENFYGAYGTVATNFLPPLVWGNDPNLEDWTYDPELSKQLLADAGFPDGLSETAIFVRDLCEEKAAALRHRQRLGLPGDRHVRIGHGDDVIVDDVGRMFKPPDA